MATANDAKTTRFDYSAPERHRAALWLIITPLLMVLAWPFLSVWAALVMLGAPLSGGHPFWALFPLLYGLGSPVALVITLLAWIPFALKRYVLAARIAQIAFAVDGIAALGLILQLAAHI